MDSILIIWDGAAQPLSVYRESCIKHIKEVYPDVNLSCITKLKEFMPSTIDTLISWEEYEKLVWDKWYVKSENPKQMSDYFRYMYLSNYPRTLYMDSDIWLELKINESDYIARYKNDSSALWNGNETKFFDYVVSLRSNNEVLNGVLKFYPYDCGDLSQYMKHKINN